MFSTLLKKLFSKTETVSEIQKDSQKKPQFIFSETEKIVEKKKEEKKKKIDELETEIGMIESRVRSLECYLASLDPSSSAEELERRKKLKELLEAKELLEERRSNKKYFVNDNSIVNDARKEEKERVTKEGELLFSKKEIGRGVGEDIERQIVRLLDNRIFLCCIEHSWGVRDTGEISTEYGQYGQPTEVSVMERTEEYYGSYVCWVTTSLSQFTEEELRKVDSLK